MTIASFPPPGRVEAVAAREAVRSVATGESPEAEATLRGMLGSPPGSAARVERFLSMRRDACLRRVREAIESVPAFWADLLSDATGTTIERVMVKAGRIACGEACRVADERQAAVVLAMGATEVMAAQKAAEAAAWPSRAARVLASLTLDLAVPLAEAGLRGSGLSRGIGESCLASAWRRLDGPHARALASGSLTNLPRRLAACPVHKRHLSDHEWACVKRLLAGATTETDA